MPFSTLSGFEHAGQATAQGEKSQTRGEGRWETGVEGGPGHRKSRHNVEGTEGSAEKGKRRDRGLERPHISGCCQAGGEKQRQRGAAVFYEVP
ncbi:unnamed protein product [Pleuronectes platessa]|uniref:Uncharacterized protein n=1 Tax=Pleuronectes platessa TaxID=8262 RepID=A0A9N7VEF9_PLEPL|nr:unnamed protein product [Pleuronectes platessa]